VKGILGIGWVLSWILIAGAAGAVEDSLEAPLRDLQQYRVVDLPHPPPGPVIFGEGERFVYSIQYGIVNAGTATLEIRNVAVIDGRPCYHIVSDARSNEVFSVFFRVHDRFESFMDTLSLVSRRYEKHLREGNYRKDERVIFDQDSLKAVYPHKTVAIAPNTQDVLSSLYYLRLLPLEVGTAVAISNHTDGKNYPLLVKVLRKERVTVDAGTFDCVVVEPVLKATGVFRQKGRLTVWLTDDRYRIPVLMKSKVVIGSVSAVLREYRLAKKVTGP
jgi:hypothetical protein